MNDYELKMGFLLIAMIVNLFMILDSMTSPENDDEDDY
jgi:hypothetical protein